MQISAAQQRPGNVPSQSRLLLVEDDEYIAEALTHFLRLHGYDITHRRDAIDALEHLRSGARFAAIVLDLMMPRMDGWEFRLVQRGEPTLADIPVIALSADRSAKAAAIDAAAFLHKPVDHRQLLATIEHVLSTHGDPSAAQTAPARSAEDVPEQARTLDEIATPLFYLLDSLAGARSHTHSLGAELSGVWAVHNAAVAKLIERAQRCAHGMTESLFAGSEFVRAGSEGTVNVATVLDRSLALVRSDLPPHTFVRRNYATLPFAVGNPVKVGQVFVNLLRNAALALAKTSTPVLSIEIRDTHDEQVVVTISDNGCGLPPKYKAHAFDPFFSTHPSGAASGLGLTIARRLVAELGGVLDFESVPSDGTTFVVSLNRAATLEPTAEETHPSKPKLLLVEDDTQTLARLGGALSASFEVEGLSSSRAALDLLLEGARYDMILCALYGQPLSGVHVYEHLSAVCPAQAARIVFLTPPGLPHHARRLLDTLGIWQLDEAHAEDVLHREASDLFRLWTTLRLRAPA